MDTIGSMIGDTSYVELENYKSEIQSYYQKRDRNREVVKYRLVNKMDLTMTRRFLWKRCTVMK